MSSEIERYSSLTREEALDGSALAQLPEASALQDIHHRMIPYLSVLAVRHIGYDGRLKEGQLVVHEGLRDTFKTVFKNLVELRYPIQQVRPMVAYDWSDARAMAANNTSSYRPDFIGDPTRHRASEHTRGSAVDINPLDNPLRNPNNTIEPVEAYGRNPREDAIIMRNKKVRDMFSDLGFEYGGMWPIAGAELLTGHGDYYPGSPSDDHHFELRMHNNNPASLTMADLPVPKDIW